MGEGLLNFDEDMAARAREYVTRQVPRLDERTCLVEAFAYALVTGKGTDATHPDTIIDRAEELADALLRRRAAGGAK